MYFTATMWFWLGTSFVRRIVGWHSGLNEQDPLLITPELMMLPIFLDVAMAQGLHSRRGATQVLGLAICVIYSLFVSFCKGEIVAGLISATDWLFPFLYFFHFVINADAIEEAEAHLRVFLLISLLVVASYSLYQWAQIPPWDAQWLQQTSTGKVSYPLPPGTRAFGPLNNAAFLAVWCGTGLVLLTYFKSKLRMLASILCFFTVALAQCRSIYLSTLTALIATSCLTRGGLTRLLPIALVGGVGLYGALLVSNPDAVTQVTSRFATMGDLQDDGSAQSRLQVLDTVPALLANSPFGQGIGSQGRGGAASNEVGNTSNIDNGFVAIYVAMGWVVGSIYIFLLVNTVIFIFSIARRSRSPLCGTLAAALLCPFCTLPFIYFGGFNGAVLWTCAGYAFALSERQIRPSHSGDLALSREPASGDTQLGASVTHV